MAERLYAEDVVQVGDELVVWIGECDITRQPEPFPQPLHGAELAAAARQAERLEVRLAEVPGCPGKHGPAADDPRQEPRVPQRSPVPPHARRHILVLQRAQAAVDGAAAPGAVIRS